MSQTSASLLERLRERPDPESWNRLVDVYTPLLLNWLRRYSVQRQDAEDVVQEVLIVVQREIRHFRHQGRVGSFRNWLRLILINRLREWWRSRRHFPVAGGESSDVMQMLNELEDPASCLSHKWNLEHDRHVLHRLLQAVEPSFRPQTWQAFWGVVIEGKKPTDVAAQLQITRNAVTIAKSRVLRRLRQEMRGLVD